MFFKCSFRAVSIQLLRPSTQSLTPTRTLYGKYFFKLDPAEKVDGYTTKALQTHKLGGRNEFGHRKARYGGGIKMEYYMVDYVRKGPEEPGKFFEEIVCELKFCYFYSPYLALVANGMNKRWILATSGLKVGDVVRTNQHIPRNPIKPIVGNNYCIGALPIGTEICHIEKVPNQEKPRMICIEAGTKASIVRKSEDTVTIRLRTKREFILSKYCMVTVGQMSNENHHNRDLGSAGARRRLGIKQRSGLWHRKTGYAGRKIKPIPPPKFFEEQKNEPIHCKRMTYPEKEETYRGIEHPLHKGSLGWGLN